MRAWQQGGKRQQAREQKWAQAQEQHRAQGQGQPRERLGDRQQQPKGQAGRGWRASGLPPAAPRPGKPCAPAALQRSEACREDLQGRAGGKGSQKRAQRERTYQGVEVEVQAESSVKISGSPGTLGSRPALSEAPDNRVSGTTVRT